MQIKLLVSPAAIALVAGLGSASADEPFSVLSDVLANPLTPLESAHVIAGATLITIGSTFRTFTVPAELLVALERTRLGGVNCPAGDCILPVDARVELGGQFTLPHEVQMTFGSP